MNLIFLLLPIIFSCFHMEEPNLLNLTPNEEKLIGQWHEIGPKVPFVDSLGNVIDSIDVNATYTFNSDFFYLADEYPLTGIEGMWSFDSVYSVIYIDPNIVDSYQTNNKWYIIHFDSSLLEVSHFFDYNLPNDTTTISVVRKFKRI